MDKLTDERKELQSEFKSQLNTELDSKKIRLSDDTFMCIFDADIRIFQNGKQILEINTYPHYGSSFNFTLNNKI